MKRLPLLLPLLLALGACDEDPIGRTPVEPIEPGDTAAAVAAPDTLPALGLGAVPERYTAEVWVRGDIGYTTTWGHRGSAAGNALKIWNVAGSVPVLLDSVIVSEATTLGDVQVSDDGRLLVVATERNPGSIVIFDVGGIRGGTPEKPVQLARHQTASTFNGVHTAEVARVGGKLYAFLSVNPMPAQLVVVDLSDPASPREVLVREMGRPVIHDVFVRDGLLFTALWDEGAVIWDVGGGGRGGTPENPVRLSSVVTEAGNVHNFWWFHDPASGSKRYLFVGEESPPYTLGESSVGDLHVVDLSDLSQPREVAFLHVPGAGAHNFTMDEASGILYAAFYNGGVRALDVRGDLGSCTAEQRGSGGRCDLRKMGREVAVGVTGERDRIYVWGVHWQGDHLYASDMIYGLWKLDVSSLRR